MLYNLNLSIYNLNVSIQIKCIMENPLISNWWTDSIKKLSENVWLPDNKISFKSNIECLKECKSTMGNNTWFSIKSNSTPYEPINPPITKYVSTVNTTKSTPNGIMKIRLYPTQHQKKVLQNMFDANRYSYNKVIEIIGDKMYDFTPGIFEAASKNARRYTTKKHMKELGVPDSIINTNSAVLDSAYQDVLKARNSTIAASVAMKLKTGNGFKLDKLKYRSKKAYSESIEIPTDSIESGVAGKNLFVEIYPRSFKFKDKVKYKPCIRKTGRTRAQIKIDAEKRLNDIKRIKDYNNSVSQIKIKIPLPKLNYAVRLQKIKPNIYYMCIPITKNIEPIITNKICSIDPGVRTMLTVLDPKDKQVYMIGNNVDELIKRSKIIDKMKSKLRKFKGKRNARYRLRKNMQLIQRKIKNMTHDMRHKTSKFLANNYKTIIYPSLKVKSICNKKHRNIYKTTARQMYLWAHYKFRELLKYKTSLRGGKVIECTEEYTSKTCSCCGRLNHNLGASKTFKCPFCKYEVDRDVGAARNIYLKNCHLI